MNWEKLGRIFCAENNSEFMVSGGRAPVAIPFNDGIFKVFFASYDTIGRGRIFSLLLDINSNPIIKELNINPVISYGAIGSFDDNGIIPSWPLIRNKEFYLYTIGFSVKNQIIFDAATGLAISIDNGKSFSKYIGPVLDRTIDDPCFAASPCVIFEKNVYKMWYVSCDKWELQKDKTYKHYYNIKYKESLDGLRWNTPATICIDYKNEYEYAISRPSVLFHNGIYKMWYSYRAQKEIDTYRIGYAESKDGKIWVRMDEYMNSFDVSTEGWDSEMICYPYVFEYDKKLFMLYNGNHYGKSGFGLAVLKE